MSQEKCSNATIGEIDCRAFNPSSDFLALCELSEDEWRRTHMGIAKALLHPDSVQKCYLAVVDGHLVGYIYCFVLPNKTLIPEFVYVLPAWRGRGIASALLRTAEAKSGCTSAMVFYNKALHNFYAGQGYETGVNLETAVKTLQ